MANKKCIVNKDVRRGTFQAANKYFRFYHFDLLYAIVVYLRNLQILSFVNQNKKSHLCFLCKGGNKSVLNGDQRFQHDSLHSVRHLFHGLAVAIVMPVKDQGKQTIDGKHDDLGSVILVFQQRTVRSMDVIPDIMVPAAFQQFAFQSILLQRIQK